MTGPYGNYAIPPGNPFADGVNGAPEVFAYGFRSPWGASFDRETGDLIFGDVGHIKDTIAPIWSSGDEEINFIRQGGRGGQNFGWRVMEGNFCAPASGQDAGGLPCNDPKFTPPVYMYPYGGTYGSGGAAEFEGRSVTGGFVYRGPIDELHGMYIFGDWASHQIWAIRIDRDANGGRGGFVPGSLINFSVPLDRPTATGTSNLLGVTSFGEDAAGNLYYVELGGRLFRIVDKVAGDYNDDGVVDAADYVVWRDHFGETFQLRNEVYGLTSGRVTTEDYMAWRERFGDTYASGARVGADRATPEPEAAILGIMALVLFTEFGRLRYCRT